CDFNCYKKATLTRRIYRRMGLAHIEELADYVQYLRDHKQEVTALYKDLLITVTNFFRDPDAWRMLEKKVVVPLVREHDLETPIRVWIPGCATGEEAYSLAILLVEQMNNLEKGLDIQIFASDIDQDALAVARVGIYPENIAADVSPDRLRHFFVKGEHTYRINKEIRDAVVFAEQNLISDPPFSKLDIVSCRNLLIYLESDVQKRILSLFHFALNENGYLLLGNSETIGQHQDMFEPVSKKWRSYRRIGAVRHDTLGMAFAAGAGKQPELPPPPARPATGRLAPLAEQIVLQRYSPACALINRRTEVLYLSGPVDQYLQVPVGEPNQILWALAREGLRTKLRTIVQQAIRGNELRALGGLRVKRGKTYCPVRVTVEPLSAPKEAAGLLLVLFEEDEPGTAGSAGPAKAQPAAQRPVDAESVPTADHEATIRQLEDELCSTRDDLQSTTEELETSNEEFKAANEEAMSVNEELQSTNEELETSKEELQSLNEELSTVNNQLEQKYSELEVTTNDLNNLLTSTDMATIFLDRRFCLKRFTPATTRLLRVIPTDVGRPLSDLAWSLIDPDLMTDAERVLDRLTQIEKEIHSDDGRWYIRRALPYCTQDNRIDGVVITYTDVNDRKTAELKIQAARAYAENIVETVRNPLVVLDNQLCVRTCNHAFYETFQVSPQETEGRSIYDLGNRQWDIPQFRRLMEEILPREKRLNNYEVTHNFEHIGHRVLQLNARAISQADGQDELILLAIEDITLRKRADEQLTVLNADLERRVAERTAEVQRASQDQARLAALVESSSAAMIGLRIDGTITDWNPAAEELFGYTAAEAAGQKAQMMIPQQQSHEFAEVLSKLEQGEAVRDFETVRLHKNGTPIDVALTLSLLRDNEGRANGIVSIVRDLREQKRMEQQMAELADQERQRMGRELHDTLGQQITAVGMVASALQEQCGDELPQAELVAKLETNVEAAKQQLR
ncbi:MAG: PAS domain S-box protein, partial [Planctomycetota bacterium]|nr:PAS domain S-box protein [Planctomycetota bacterium]